MLYFLFSRGYTHNQTNDIWKVCLANIGREALNFFLRLSMHEVIFSFLSIFLFSDSEPWWLLNHPFI